LRVSFRSSTIISGQRPVLRRRPVAGDPGRWIARLTGRSRAHGLSAPFVPRQTEAVVTGFRHPPLGLP
jgi:hypothetical protein